MSMFRDISTEIKQGIIIVVIAALIGIALNQARTPILNSLAEKGTIHPAVANNYEGIKIVDDWSHGGMPEAVTKLPSNEDENDNFDERVEIVRIDSAIAVEKFESGAIFIDARPMVEYNESHISGAISWPYDHFLEYLEKYANEIDYQADIVVYCNGGDCDQSYQLSQDLIVSGYKKVNLYLGGLDEWKLWEQPVEYGAGGEWPSN